MPGAHLMGFEQEMALCAMGQDGGRIDTESLMPHLFALAAKSLVHLPGVGDGGMFLGNGSRLYQDCGKVEYAGPECSSPDEIVQHLLAAERILAKLADDLSNKPGLADVGLYRCQVDYTSKNSWGAHESYLTRCNPRQLADDLIPFFVARVVTAGAGGFRPLTDTGCSFTLSPRASHIGFPISESSTASRERGIFHLKDESLSVRGYHRLHTIVGDACCSQKQNWLKFAATSIAVALADQQLHPGRDVMLADPVDALRKFASDPTCKAKAKTLAGWEISAIEVQRHYLELARTYLHAPWMAAWAAEAIEQWDAMLHLLEGAPDSVATCLDWGIKYNLFRSHIERSGFDLARLRYWTQATDIVHRCIKATPGAQRNPAPSSRHLSKAHGAVAEVISQLAEHLSAHGIDWEQLDAYLKLRTELFALDFKFARLGEKGIFNRLDRAGVLDHTVRGIDDARIDYAVAHPPATSRAKIRGEVIHRLHGNKADCLNCSWMAVFDGTRHLVLDLRDPFVAEERWDKPSRGRVMQDSPW